MLRLRRDLTLNQEHAAVMALLLQHDCSDMTEATGVQERQQGQQTAHADITAHMCLAQLSPNNTIFICNRIQPVYLVYKAQWINTAMYGSLVCC